MSYKERSRIENKRAYKRAEIIRAIIAVVSIIAFMVGVSGIEGNTGIAAGLAFAGIFGALFLQSFADYTAEEEEEDEEE